MFHLQELLKLQALNKQAWNIKHERAATDKSYEEVIEQGYFE
jgi:hypothetical protein